jgi:sugar/nucleoside kinase (ribokinase family)
MIGGLQHSRSINIKRVLAIGPTGLDIRLNLSVLHSKVSSATASFTLSSGGSCRNLAVNLATLGLDVTLLTQDYGRSLENLGIRSNVEIREKQIRTPKGSKGSLALFVAAVDEKDIVASLARYEFARTLFNEDAANELLEFFRDFEVLISTSSVGHEFWERVKHSCQGTQQLKCLMTGGLPLPEDYLGWLDRCDLLFINRNEAELLGFGPEDFCNEAVNRGTKAALVTLDRDSAVYYCEQGGTPKRKTGPSLGEGIVSVVGAGDVFAAGVIYGVMAARDLSDAVDLGLLLAAKFVTQDNNVLNKTDDLEKIVPPL